MEFLIGAIAASCAGFFTNPLEVLKTRMQFQGELQAKGQHAVHYKNILSGAYVIAKNDGFLALQRGLIPATAVQLIMNGWRLGFYDYHNTRGRTKDEQGNNVLYKTVLISGTGGVIGHLMATPFYMIKTHIQTQSVQSIAVGHQHKHEGTWQALRKIYNKQGIVGLYRGSAATIPRAFVASSSQLAAFFYSKEWLRQFETFRSSPILTSFTGSMIGGVAISVMVTPFDLVLMRLYNQAIDKNGQGVLYKGYFHCVRMIYKTEGIWAFYKGLGPMYFRLGPHTVLCLLFWDKLKELVSE